MDPTQTEQEFLAEARERYSFGLAVDAEDRAEAEEDNRFANSSDTDLGQWDPETRQSREKAKRPIQQWNRIPTYIQQIANDARQNKPSIKIAPADGGTRETADYFQNRIRHIEYESDADIAFDSSRDQQVTSGRGNIRVSLEIIPGTFRQRACIDRIENQFSVVWDPAAKKYDRSDAEWCFIVDLISKDKHRRDYGPQSLVNRSDFTANGENPAPGWINVGPKGELIQIAEYWKKEYKKRILCLLRPAAGGELPIWKDELTPENAPFVVEEREDQDAVIYQYIINGAEILRPDGGTGPEKKEWIGSTIPIVPVWGREAVVGGKRRTFSLIRNAREPQRILNFEVSNLVEQLAQMPKTPYLVAIGQIPSHLIEDWQEIGSKPLGYLLFNRYDEQGRDLGIPQRVVQTPPIEPLVIAINQAVEGIKAAMGIFDSLGARPNQASGVAIQRAQNQINVTNFHFPDNEARSRKRVGEILVEIIPLIDKPGDKVPVRTEDGKTFTVPIGTEYKDPKTGQPVTHVLTAGDYAVSVSTGPSYQSARQEAYDRDAALITAQPDLMFVIGDQLFANDDTAGAEDRSERLKKFISMKTPGLIKQPGEQQEVPPVVQQQLVELEGEAQKAHAFAQSLHEQLKAKLPELENAIRLKQMELDFAREKLAVDDQNKKLEIASREGIAELQEQMAVLMNERELALKAAAQQAGQDHEAGESGRDREHQASQAEAERAAQIVKADADRRHQAEQADAGREHESAQAEADRIAAERAADNKPKETE